MATVNAKMVKVMEGFTKLDSHERAELVNWISKYQATVYGYQQTELMESIRKTAGVSLGPLSSGSCPCCGR